MPDTRIIEEWSRRFTKHELKEATEDCKIFRLGLPGTINMSCYISFTPAGITISGDISPTMNGTTSTRGYGINWFASQLSPGYLAEKFLHQRFIPELAVEALNDPNGWIQEYLREKYEENQEALKESMQELRSISGLVDSREIGPEELGHRLQDDIGADLSDGMPGWDYDPDEVAILVAIQRRFAELRKAETSV